jgi:hypothetical protein
MSLNLQTLYWFRANHEPVNQSLVLLFNTACFTNVAEKQQYQI